jgi:hypothetical protein
VESTDRRRYVKIAVAVTYLLMITVNALANVIPINGLTTGQVSDAYPNLFAPAGLTFGIWGVIYILLGMYTLYILGLFRGDQEKIKISLLIRTGLVFAISSVVNSLWIFAWHYRLIWLSMVLMIILLLCLIAIVLMIKAKHSLTFREQIFIRLPFSVYFGWITIATIANAAVFLVSLHWKGFGFSEPTWTIIMLIVGTLLGAYTMMDNNDLAYGLVIVWAYVGILIKHMSNTGFNGMYPEIIIVVYICLVALLLALTRVVNQMPRRREPGENEIIIEIKQ